eukprot:CAMPEP_0197658322 /NCGR_PEP_ID=MMETSP1338-20131121/45170_1 /TAXON_ID=43686 ORGANISM="Pelagodinium beii, Strain RCC1491" /NCGR_SAMPLE_ID=MMETSP1338 /ASSEMBLY_ACC=CAM_ASM_000754 /LENGTH=198 /DNA_ID=CAMNT_0043234891 /DNA_START=115 /DNA_END=708 /DNA_ORIENTATION=+
MTQILVLFVFIAVSNGYQEKGGLVRREGSRMNVAQPSKPLPLRRSSIIVSSRGSSSLADTSEGSALSAVDLESAFHQIDNIDGQASSTGFGIDAEAVSSGKRTQNLIHESLPSSEASLMDHSDDLAHLSDIEGEGWPSPVRYGMKAGRSSADPSPDGSASSLIANTDSPAGNDENADDASPDGADSSLSANTDSAAAN